MSSNVETMFGYGPNTTNESNPLKSDPELVNLLKKLDKVKKYKSFQRWKSKFLERLETFLYEDGMKPAEVSCDDFSAQLKKFVKQATKVQTHIDNGELSDTKKTVKAALSLNEMCKMLTTLVGEVETLIPTVSREEKKKGFTKFHLGAVLIRQGFHQYITMKAIEDALKAIGDELQQVADKQQHELFEYYSTMVQRFCDVMADLNLYEVMMKCLEFQEAPEEEESTSVEPITYAITVDTHDGKTLTLVVEPTDTVISIKEAIADACRLPPDRQVLKLKGNKELGDDNATLEAVGVQDGDKLTVEPFKVPVTVNTLDGKSIDIMVDPYDYISDIKRSLEDESGLAAKNQRLFKEGEELSDLSKTAGDYGIKAGTVLDLEPKTITLNVKTPDGKTHAIEVKSSDTTDGIKAKVEDETGMKAGRQVLKHNGKQLPDGKSLKDMGISDGSNLDVEVYKVPITVNTLDGESIKLMVEPSDYISAIKGQLEKETGLAPKNQKLLMQGTELIDPNKTADEYGIKEGSVLDLEPKSINISVRTPDGKTHQIPIKANDSAEGIKAKIEEETGLAAPRQVLSFQGKELKDGQTVKQAGITDGSELNCDIFKVPISVNTLEGNKIKLMIEPSGSVADIKKQLEAESGLKASNQKLFFNGTELADPNKSAESYGIKAGSVLELEPKVIKVNVKDNSSKGGGKVHTIEVKSSDMGDDLKTKVAKETGIASARQVLKHQGTTIAGDATVKKLGISDGSELTMDLFTIPITVTTYDGKTIDLDVEPCDTIDTVKKVLQDKTSIETKRQCLKHGNQELSKGKQTVKEYDIHAGSKLLLELHADPIIFVDIKCGTLFAMEREDVVAKQALTPHQGNKLDFAESSKDSASREKIMEYMKNSPTLGFSPQVVVAKEDVEDYEMAEAEKVKNMWGVNLKKRERNKKGQEFLFFDPKTGACGELTRKKYLDSGFITVVTDDKGKETLAERETDGMQYDRYILELRKIFGVKFE